jgi:hypothetical protein
VDYVVACVLELRRKPIFERGPPPMASADDDDRHRRETGEESLGGIAAQDDLGADGDAVRSPG